MARTQEIISLSNQFNNYTKHNFIMDEFIGIVKLFAGTFAPKGWMLCQGQLISINQYTAVFSILGTNYGGDGVTTFGLPDLRGKTAIGCGQAQGGTIYNIGQASGTENVSILPTNMPSHTHTLRVSNTEGSVAVPVTGNSLAAMVDTSVNKIFSYSTAIPTVDLNPSTIALAGGNTPVSIMQPYLPLTYIICIAGVFPSRN